jgi:hypothetical protein
MRSLGLLPGAVVGLRVIVASLAAPDSWSEGSFGRLVVPGEPVVRLVSPGPLQSSGFSCHVEDLGLWTASLSPDFSEAPGD